MFEASLPWTVVRPHIAAVDRNDGRVIHVPAPRHPAARLGARWHGSFRTDGGEQSRRQPILFCVDRVIGVLPFLLLSPGPCASVDIFLDDTATILFSSGKLLLHDTARRRSGLLLPARSPQESAAASFLVAGVSSSFPEGDATIGTESFSWWEARRLDLQQDCLLSSAFPSFVLYHGLFVSAAANLPPRRGPGRADGFADRPGCGAHRREPVLHVRLDRRTSYGGLVSHVIGPAGSGQLFMGMGIGFTLFVILFPSTACWGAAVDVAHHHRTQS